MSVLYPPNGPPTPRYKAMFLALGCSQRGDLYTWDSLPSFPTRVDVPTFPMLVFCRSENEFHKMRTVAPWIYCIAQQGLTTRQGVADALELLREKPSIRRVLTSHRPSWPVFGGNGGLELISFLWADAHDLYVGQDFPKIGTRRENLLDAMIWFMLRDVPGIDSVPVGEDFDQFTAQLAQLQVSVRSPSPDAPARSRCPETPRSPQRKPQAAAMEPIVIDSESETEPPAPATPKVRKAPPKRTKVFRTPARVESQAGERPVVSTAKTVSTRPVSVSLDPEATRGTAAGLNVPTSASSDKAKELPAPPTASPQLAIAPTSDGAAAAIPDHGAMGSHAPHDVPVYVGSGPHANGRQRPRMYQHIRDVSGHIVQSHAQAFSSQEVIVPSFGLAMDRFLDAFGFPDDICWILAACYDHSQDVMHFCNLMLQCVSFSEAYWMWYMIQRGLPSQPIRTRENSISSD
ncbi:hypothetical protein PHLGIDRAFT_123349 [Phlebiopsis gigantea 11061_1 CR5-6]|uniref:Uncharacterized protein n=1 Tax=Phlebiopsis gigantea (strain 11061_1 CR5-6) TaxID=745531 RepID=A0A0C3RYT2_PHLG1|nr:hypothetical protein PHLGIDRAFT_123349 [Phlebiopsis gigantea 11061_1 CR5-6]